MSLQQELPHTHTTEAHPARRGRLAGLLAVTALSVACSQPQQPISAEEITPTVATAQPGDEGVQPEVHEIPITFPGIEHETPDHDTAVQDFIISPERQEQLHDALNELGPRLITLIESGTFGDAPFFNYETGEYSTDNPHTTGHGLWQRLRKGDESIDTIVVGAFRNPDGTFDAEQGITTISVEIQDGDIARAITIEQYGDGNVYVTTAEISDPNVESGFTVTSDERLATDENASVDDIVQLDTDALTRLDAYISSVEDQITE